MHSSRARFFTAATIAGTAASLVLAGCGPQPGAPAAASGIAVSATAERTATLTAPPPSASAPAAPATGGVPTSKVAASSPKHAAPALKTWTVRTVLPPAGLPGVEATVADAAGNDRLFLASGVTTGCAGGPVSRQVFDHAAVPGMMAPNGTKPSFGFVVGSYGSGEAYFMGLTDPRSLKEGDGVASWCNLVPTANCGLITRVLFTDPGFPNKAAAKAWMATDQYAQLKALLVSLNYT